MTQWINHQLYRIKIGIKDSSLDPSTLNLISFLGGKEVCRLISKLTGCKSSDLLSLGDIVDHQYSPYHISKDGGFLVTHVDHSYICDKKKTFAHIANAIFYISNKWEEGWGGETLLFSRSGLSIKKQIKPVPNRLVIFLHSSTSFHGVKRYNSGQGIPRETIYNDYYIDPHLIGKLKTSLRNIYGSNFTFSHHSTTCLPVVHFGLEDYLRLPFRSKIRNFLKSSYEIKTYLIYTLHRLFRSSPGQTFSNRLKQFNM